LHNIMNAENRKRPIWRSISSTRPTARNTPKQSTACSTIGRCANPFRLSG
jgi:hypothetical protein